MIPFNPILGGGDGEGIIIFLGDIASLGKNWVIFEKKEITQ